jgi:replicative DNA helicase
VSAPATLVPVPKGRVPPHSLDAEKSALGGLLLYTGSDKNAALDELAEVLKPEDFYREAHRKIFEAMLALHAKDEPVDRVMLKKALVEMGALEAVGGEHYIDLLDTTVPSASNLLYYGTIVHEKALARRLIEAAHAISSQGYEDKGPVGELLDDAERRIFAVTEVRAQKTEATNVRDIAKPFFRSLEERYENRRQDRMVGVPSGLERLDDMTHGFRNADLVFIAARPGNGKTSLLGRILEHAAADLGIGAGMFSLEQSKEAIFQRMVCSRARVDFQRVDTGDIIESDWAKMAKATGELSEAPLLIDDTGGITLFEFKARARRMARRLEKEGKKLGILGIDYLQLMQMNDKADTRDLAIGEATRGLKTFAKEMGIPIIALSQLNRALEKRPDKRPIKSDLRESGNIENDADLILFIHRPELYEKDQAKKEELAGIAELIVDKQRNGPTGIREVAFIGEFMRFENLASNSYSNQRDWTEPQHEGA